MPPENESIVLPPTAERVSRELSRWFDHSELATRPKPGLAVRDPAKRIDWVRVAPFLAMHAACLAVIWVGFSWVALARGAVLVRAAGRLGRAARPDLVGRTPPPPPHSLGQAR